MTSDMTSRIGRTACCLALTPRARYLAVYCSKAEGLLKASPWNAAICSILWCITIIGFAATNSYGLGVMLLFCAGLLNLAFHVDGANSGATQGAGATARAIDRSIQHVEQWPQGV